MRTLPIRWQRLVNSKGATCPRCQGTGGEVRRAVAQLRSILEPRGIEPVLEEEAIDEAAFRADTLRSNEVLVAGRPIDWWLGGQAGSSRCCAACGDSDCRTLELDGQSYDVIPEALIVRAGLAAASQLSDPRPGA
jgi:hypothetical protein